MSNRSEQTQIKNNYLELNKYIKYDNKNKVFMLTFLYVS
jgi:hypothetical protein